MTSLEIIIYEKDIPGILKISFNPTFTYSIAECGSLFHNKKDEINSFLEFTLKNNKYHDTHLKSLEHMGSITHLKESNAIESVQLMECDDHGLCDALEMIFYFSDDTPKQELIDIIFSLLLALNLAGHSFVSGILIYDELKFLTSLKNKKLQLIYIGVHRLEHC